MKPPKPDSCATCRREVELSFHHFVPKKTHGKPVSRRLHTDKNVDHYGMWVCLDCHKKIHRLFTHQELAERYYSLPALMSHAPFQKFIHWVKKQKKRVK